MKLTLTLVICFNLSEPQQKDIIVLFAIVEIEDWSLKLELERMGVYSNKKSLFCLDPS